MKFFKILSAALSTFAFTSAAFAWGGGDYGYWERSKQEYWDGPCRVKIESKPYEYKKEVKCEDGFSPVPMRPGKRNIKTVNAGLNARRSTTNSKKKSSAVDFFQYVAK